MRRIQVDMFEVQLGAALLVQFTTTGGTVRVLADAGVKASGYPVDHVHGKLQDAFDAFGDSSRRLDLIIGTHYDEDHLVGLVPIIEDTSISIGEAWMPPVANDTQPLREDRAVGEDDLLVRQLAAKDGAQHLTEYLTAKHAVCQQSAGLERAADRFRSDRPRVRRPDLGPKVAPRGARDASQWAQIFRAHAEDAAITLGPGAGDLTHAGALYEMRDDDGAEPNARSRPDDVRALDEDLPGRWADNPVRATSDALDLAIIRQAAARDAINAIALAEVVAALAARSIPIRCPIIPDGTPQRYRWRSAERRFVASSARGGTNPGLTLLGPSESLVRKHWTRLPVGAYLARSARAQIPIQSITPSNQLSYVARLSYAGQGILVSGDAGFVDFAPPQGAYYPGLIHALLPLHLVQVAHHAGNNAHFYRALLEAGYGDQAVDSLLLVSHATRDKHRPSAEFAMFLEQARAAHEGLRILFTSKPSAAKVRSFREAIHPVVGKPATVGDVRIVFDDDRWLVERHAVRA
jgi:hypothetical protein